MRHAAPKPVFHLTSVCMRSPYSLFSMEGHILRGSNVRRTKFYGNFLENCTVLEDDITRIYLI